MICAKLAGIEVFATGGIGGASRRGTQLRYFGRFVELAQTPVTVVCAGAKAILDLPKTLEVLETLGVPVIAYGQDQLPAFWSRESGLEGALRMDSAAQIARAAAARKALAIPGGQLVANPIPVEAEIPRATIGPIVEQALADPRATASPPRPVTPICCNASSS